MLLEGSFWKNSVTLKMHACCDLLISVLGLEHRVFTWSMKGKHTDVHSVHGCWYQEGWKPLGCPALGRWIKQRACFTWTILQQMVVMLDFLTATWVDLKYIMEWKKEATA